MRQKSCSRIIQPRRGVTIACEFRAAKVRPMLTHDLWPERDLYRAYPRFFKLFFLFFYFFYKGQFRLVALYNKPGTENLF